MINLLNRIANECFSKTQREILAYSEDELIVTVEDQLYAHFYELFPRYIPDVLVRKFKTIVMENRFMILQIKEAKEHAYKALTNSEQYKDIETTTYDTIDETLAEQKGETNTTIDNKQTSLAESEGESYVANAGIARSASTQTSQIKENVEDWDDNRVLKLQATPKIGKQLKADAADVSDSLQEKPKEIENIIVGENKNLPYNSFDLSLSKDKQQTYNINLGVNKSFSDSKTKAEISGHQTTDLKKTGTVILEKTNPALSSQSVLMQKIPNLYARFWRCFNVLFDTRPLICTT